MNDGTLRTNLFAMHSLTLRTLSFVSSALVCLACAKPKAEGNSGSEQTTTTQVASTKEAPLDPSVEAKRTFDAKCSACHGSTGMGDGPGAQALDPKPRNFSDSAWQAAITDEQIQKIIKEGGPAVGKSAGMPGNPDLAGKEAVLAELVKLVRSFGK